MKVDFPVFVALAAGLHVLFFAQWPQEDGGQETGGQGGENSVTMTAASAELAAMVEEWERPPEIAPVTEAPQPVAQPDIAPPPPAPQVDRAVPQALPDRPAMMDGQVALPSFDTETPLPPEPEAEAIAPERAETATPDAAPDLPQPTRDTTPDRPEPPQRQAPQRMAALPQIDTTPPEPQPEPEPQEQASSETIPRTSLRPPPQRPERVERPAPVQEATRPEPQRRPEPRQAETRNQGQGDTNRNAQRSAGTGGAAQAGNATASGARSLSRAQQQRLISVWGAKIRARIESRKRHPGGRGGRVVVSLTVSPSGQVTAAGISRSSGLGALDRAAVQAIRSAGRMPRAPRELGGAPRSFSLPMDFR